MQHQNSNSDAYFGIPEVSQILPPWNLPPAHAFNPAHFTTRDHEHDSFLVSPPSYGGLFNRRPPFGYEGLVISSESLGHHGGSAGAAPFGLHAELQKLSAQEIMDAKALAASKSHSEAERRRRERINNHLAKLRSLLPSTTKDRSDLLPDLIKTLKALRLKTLRAEITTLGGRVKNVLFITGEDQDSNSFNGYDEEEQENQQYSISSIQEALKAVMEKSNGDENGSGSVKRQRTNTNILEYRSF
ncbi:hypothetical protein DH2020_049835 [Rehmannia glutinosa]|uniref:BHLH domain-containing protein n=1 Tax=Rehmannia glutinosa TaxID=99300 RepID=A0ABR0U1L5_REHGL